MDMLQDFLKTKLIDGLGFLPTASQEEAAGVLGEFLATPTDRSAFILKGYAGTGKTTMVKAVVQVLSELKQKAFLLAPTGRAAKVLSNSVGMPAYTIHKKIYRQQSSRDGFAAFDLNKIFIRILYSLWMRLL